MVSFFDSKLTGKRRKEQNSLVNKSSPIVKTDQEELAQLIFSPFVHLFNIDEMTKCLFNSLTLKKVYLTNEMYVKVLTDLSVGNRSDRIKRLIKLKFIVPQGFDQEKVFDTVADTVLRKVP